MPEEDPTVARLHRLDRLESALDDVLYRDGRLLAEDDHRILSEMYDLILGLRRNADYPIPVPGSD